MRGMSAALDEQLCVPFHFDLFSTHPLSHTTSACVLLPVPVLSGHQFDL